MPKKSKPKKVHIVNQPVKVKIEPEPLPPPPTKQEIKAQEKAALEAKLAEDREARYVRNKRFNKENSQGPAAVFGIDNCPPVYKEGLKQFYTAKDLAGFPDDIIRKYKNQLITSCTTKELQKIQSGKGVKEDGTWDHQIEDIMKKYPAFKGVIAADEIKTLPADKKIAFVMNTAKRSEPGEHWVSCLIDTSPNVRSIEYFDPFGKSASKKFIRDIRMLADKINSETYLLYKWNKIQQQDADTNTCGLHAMNFLMKRLKGKSFIDATGYNGRKRDQTDKYEKEVTKKFRLLM